MLSAFPLRGARQLGVWLRQSWPVGSSLTLGQRWSHGFKWWGCFSSLEHGLCAPEVGCCHREPVDGPNLPSLYPKPLRPAWSLSGALCPK